MQFVWCPKEIMNRPFAIPLTNPTILYIVSIHFILTSISPDVYNYVRSLSSLMPSSSLLTPSQPPLHRTNETLMSSLSVLRRHRVSPAHRTPHDKVSRNPVQFAIRLVLVVLRSSQSLFSNALLLRHRRHRCHRRPRCNRCHRHHRCHVNALLVIIHRSSTAAIVTSQCHREQTRQRSHRKQPPLPL